MNDAPPETKRLLSVKRIALGTTEGRRPLGALPVGRIIWGDASRDYLSNFLRATAAPLAAITASTAAAPRGAASPVAGRLAACEESSLDSSPSLFASAPEPLPASDPSPELSPEPDPEPLPVPEPLLPEPLSEPDPPLLSEPAPEPLPEPLSVPGSLSPLEPDPLPAFSS